MQKRESKMPFGEVLAALRDESSPLTSDMIERLSDLSESKVAELRPVWAGLSVDRRRRLIEALVDASENEFTFDFDGVMILALDDPDSYIRAIAVDGVMTDELLDVIETVRGLAEADPVADVRAKAVSKLGQYILLGEYEELPEEISQRLQETALALYRSASEPLEVRRRALEAIANCEREEVEGMIREAYRSPELLMRVSAVCAMGRTCDEVWAPEVLAELGSEHPELRYEAANAAGEIELPQAVPYLVEMARGEDREIQLVAVWSLGEIGGQRAESILDDLGTWAESRGDDDLLDAVDEARDAAMLDTLEYGDEDFLQTAMEHFMPMFDFDGHDHGAHHDEAFDDGEDDEIDDLIEDTDEEFDNDFGELPGYRVFSEEDEDDDLLDEDFDADDFEGLDEEM